MKLSSYDRKQIQITDLFGERFTGIADYCDSEYCLNEFGNSENGIRIGNCVIYESQIASIEEVERHGTAELWTQRLALRRYRLQDADNLYHFLGKDPAMYQYSGWNPYATLEMAQQTVRRFIDNYEEEHFYGWAIDFEEVLIGTIGAYDYENGRIEVGFSIVRNCWGQGYATEALKEVLWYLTQNEHIPCVTAWCAEKNTGSRRVLEKAGMQLIRTETDSLSVNGITYDKLIYEFREKS